MAALMAALLHGADQAEVARLTIWVGGIAIIAAVMLAWFALDRAWEISLGLGCLGGALVATGAIWRVRLWRRDGADEQHSSP
jgi:hypothetical protein